MIVVMTAVVESEKRSYQRVSADIITWRIILIKLTS